jgi:hypothetical protein
MHARGLHGPGGPRAGPGRAGPGFCHGKNGPGRAAGITGQAGPEKNEPVQTSNACAHQRDPEKDLFASNRVV